MIKGKYIVKSGDEVIAEAENLVTLNGITAINQYLTNQIADWAGSIGYGAIPSSTTSSYTRLRYELGKSLVSSKIFLSASNQIVIKASVPNNFSGEIFELGVFPTNVIDGNKDAFVFTNFDEIISSTGTGSSAWLQGLSHSDSNNAASLSGFSRASASSIYVNTSSVLSNFSIVTDLSDYTTADWLHLLYYVPAVITPSPSVTFTFYDSNSASWSSSVTSLATSASGYVNTIIKMNTPSVDWSGVVTNISASFATTSTSSNKFIVFDALRFREDQTTGVKPVENMLVSIASASGTTALFKTTYGQPLQIEYYLTVS